MRGWQLATNRSLTPVSDKANSHLSRKRASICATRRRWLDHQLYYRRRNRRRPAVGRWHHNRSWCEIRAAEQLNGGFGPPCAQFCVPVLVTVDSQSARSTHDQRFAHHRQGHGSGLARRRPNFQQLCGDFLDCGEFHYLAIDGFDDVFWSFARHSSASAGPIDGMESLDIVISSPRTKLIRCTRSGAAGPADRQEGSGRERRPGHLRVSSLFALGTANSFSPVTWFAPSRRLA